MCTHYNHDVLELRLLLIVYIIGEPTLFVINRSFKSLFKFYHRGKKKDGSDQRYIPKWERDFTMDPVPPHAMTEAYADLTIQYGFVTMYPAVFPFTAIFTILQNFTTLRYLAYRFTKEWRRGVPEKSVFRIVLATFQAITSLAVVVTAWIIARSTEFIPRFVHWCFDYDVYASYIDVILPEVNVSSVKTPLILPDPSISTCRTSKHDRYCIFGRDAPNEGHHISRKYDAASYEAHHMLTSICFILVFILSMAIVYWLIDHIFDDIPTMQKNYLKKERRLAQNAIREYLIQTKEKSVTSSKSVNSAK